MISETGFVCHDQFAFEEQIAPGQDDGRNDEGQVDDDLPHDQFGVDLGSLVFDIDADFGKGLQQVDARHADEGAGQLGLERARIDVIEPSWSIFGSDVDLADEGDVAADDDHDNEVGDHQEVNHAQDQHQEVGFMRC